MKKAKAIPQPNNQRPRILFFDIIRIICVAIIVYDHNQCGLLPLFNSIFFSDGWLPFNIYPSSLVGPAVYGMILVSGAVLEYNYRGIERVSEYLAFIVKRFIRLYPAFWMSLILGILLAPTVLQNNIWGILFEFTGFFMILGQGPGTINMMGWFIGTIFLLYIIFPYLSKAVKRYELTSLAVFFIVTYASRYYCVINSASLNLLWRWMPICNLFEFCLGIYLVQKKLYPKSTGDYPVIRTLSELSFYVFLFHVIVMNAFIAFSQSHQQLYYLEQTVGITSEPIGYLIWYILTIGIILLVSWIAMMIDSRVQQVILDNPHVKRILKGS